MTEDEQKKIFFSFLSLFPVRFFLIKSRINLELSCCCCCFIVAVVAVVAVVFIVAVVVAASWAII